LEFDYGQSIILQFMAVALKNNMYSELLTWHMENLYDLFFNYYL